MKHQSRYSDTRMGHERARAKPKDADASAARLVSNNSTDVVISIKNISKKYQITHKNARYSTLRDSIAYALRNPFGHLKNQTKKIIGRDTKEEFWALKDINLLVKKGEVIGIIGKNGAGKSTLLKILTGITPPTEGEIRIKGKVASLLEVGTGFHPELTGRENIYLNGAILGMKRAEIKSKFDQIVEFSGIEKFLDTPVKRYSSGMYVRLAFSVAAHLDPDILLVDEVLAVGDTEFQKKCLGKMDEVTKAAGRTILFVSHNMDAIRRLCKTTVLVDKGRIAAFDDTDKVIAKYLAEGYRDEEVIQFPLVDGEVTLNDFCITQNGATVNTVTGEGPFEIRVDLEVARQLTSFRTGIYIRNSSGTLISRSFMQDWDPSLEKILPGHYKTALRIPEKLLMGGNYEIELKLFRFSIGGFFTGRSFRKSINVHDPKDYNGLPSRTGETGYFLIPTVWEVQR